ncbi:hypothetical protein FSZ31_10730 [Sphingorhabdus soli]|uniref:Uncharacterized protein n=1 Tax=Flavisphingopyxis soli TaxID=2601267 RepID=A0A5C6U5Q5_9SPHN|nr:hypothetical protein [Sphingorhabdus soli]TXC68167.1 hypothetical protein FSZ31_10730 [Sphingorhabdus soli]
MEIPVDENDARDQFFIARAEALNAYALMEKGLTFLFARTLGTNPRYATLIISKINSARTRNEIVQRVTDDHTAKTFRPFTNSMFKMIGTVDELRNHLVHWHVGERNSELMLVPSDVLTKSEACMTENEIDALRAKCLFIANALSEFGNHLENWGASPALHERFLLPLVYPPEPDDPLGQMHKALLAPQKPSAE